VLLHSVNNVVRHIANNPLHTRVYNVLFRNTSTMVATVLVGSVVLESVVDSTVNQAWNIANRGVTKTTHVLSLASLALTSLSTLSPQRRFNDMISARRSKGLPVGE
jgi:hypothetical protein